MQENYTVYEHINKINGKIYIGITSQEPERRWGNNGSNYRTSPHFYSAIQKYGWDNFEHIILFTGLTKEEAVNKEKELIVQYNATNPDIGYNQTSGGEHFTMSAEARAKLSQAMRGNKNGLGHPCSEEKKRKISEAQKGRTFTPEHRQKLSEAAKKRHVPCSEEKKKTLSANYPHKRKVYCQETGEVYESVQECARQLHLYATNVTKACKGKIHSTGGYHLSYYDDIINA